MSGAPSFSAVAQGTPLVLEARVAYNSESHRTITVRQFLAGYCHQGNAQKAD